MTDRLPSWRPGPVRDAIITYLDGLDDVPTADRVAYFDNDGTLWCERPGYVQLDFFVDELRRRADHDPSLRARREFDAVLRGDPVAMGEVGLEKIAMALAGLFDGIGPAEFASIVDDFVERYRHPLLGVPITGLVYQPMLELLGELRALDFTVGIVTGGGTEFVRRISEPLYGVPPELVVGTLIGYELDRDEAGRPSLRRTVSLMGRANEGATKVAQIQSQLGRPPIVAGGNSGGDREMMEWACVGPHPGLAILVDHDDAEREYAYVGKAQTFEETEPITDVAARLGWVTVSMARDWATVFPEI
jgi:phosphoglycolate phosphatase-like HAD superfamily hydrolase